MECRDIENKLNDYLEDNLSEIEKSEVEHHLKTCANCQQELAELKSFLAVLDNDTMETPSANLKLNFEQMLAQEIERHNPKVVQLKPKTDWKSYLRVAASILIVISAFLLGKYQPNKTSSIEKNTAQVLTLLEDNSASKRILAVNNAEEFTSKNTKIIEALINRLFFDKNTNVRLAAAEALSKFSSEELVRDALIKSLETDKSTIVQIEVITILSKIQEKRAIKPMEKMLENEETPQYVKQQLELNLSTLL
ncbi:HEAT repeat domain-containing protein [Polaribacter vadi]|uniref:HEAT repeat domain-containing protein n=1 Tax=Polaribacter TaxID=52959 RepID=UPI001C07F127|nr:MULTISPECIES: HEAT repeat domain-containing protein [Polaribacter]MBU3010211.1 HEAT repeat domain-containing protein [Polaribacter vadi]MDO6740018.1 HEAT repeat domain-containing protein [Polaribacter sp. 1_MG-2023]